MRCDCCVARSSSASTTSTPRRSTRSFADGTGPQNDFTSLDIANELIREALAPYPDDLLIATKVGPTASGLARPDQLPALVEADLRALGRDHLDLVYLRQGGLESVAEHFGVLAELQQAGLIRHLGISSVRAEHLTQAQEIAPVAAVSNRYAVDFGRVNDDLLDSCAAQGIAFVPFFALTGEGREVGGVAAHDVVSAVAQAHDATPAQVRLAWALEPRPARAGHPGHQQRGAPGGEPRRCRPRAVGRRAGGAHGARVIWKTWLVTWPPAPRKPWSCSEPTASVTDGSVAASTRPAPSS